MTVNQSEGRAGTDSGLGFFKPVNEFSENPPFIDFGEPLQVLSLLAVLAIAAYAYKRFKK